MCSPEPAGLQSVPGGCGHAAASCTATDITAIRPVLCTFLATGTSSIKLAVACYAAGEHSPPHS